MSTSDAPFKTPSGQEELRLRSRGLGQRYRTVLLLVDGRRPLGEVLAMAHKAGAQTSHFEELVRMGLVEVPSEVAAPEPEESIAGALDTGAHTSVELDVIGEPPLRPEIAAAGLEEEGALQAQGAAVAGDSAATAPALVTMPAAASTALPSEPPQAEVVMGSAQGLPMIEVGSIAEAPAGPAAPAAVSAAAGSRYQDAQVTLSAAPRLPEWMQQARETPFKVADHARAAPKMTDEQRLQYVRDLLVDTLRRDSLLFATFSIGRVRAAVTQKDLIKLVWEIERDRAHTRRNRDQLLNLQRVRELLGMGNTLVAGDSQPGGVSSEF